MWNNIKSANIGVRFPEGKNNNAEKKIWRNNGLKHPKFDETH